MNNDLFLWLLDWYHSQFNGEWEYKHGINIYTLDNPGWNIQIDVQGIDVERKVFRKILLERSKNDWLF